MVVCVRTNTTYQAVLMPLYDNAESAATYYAFLNNEEETLSAYGCEFRAAEECWHGSPDMIEMRWPKGDETIDLGCHPDRQILMLTWSASCAASRKTVSTA